MEHAEDADDMEDMSQDGTGNDGTETGSNQNRPETEEERLQKQLQEQAALQKLIQDEMDTQSIATTIHPSQV